MTKEAGSFRRTQDNLLRNDPPESAETILPPLSFIEHLAQQSCPTLPSLACELRIVLRVGGVVHVRLPGSPAPPPSILSLLGRNSRRARLA